MYLLGFNSYVHNSAAALLDDGVPVAAAQQERFDRRRHSGVFPAEAIDYCLGEAGIGPSDIDHVCFHWRPFHQLHRRLASIAVNLPESLRLWPSHRGRWWNMVRAPRDVARHLALPRGAKRPRFWRTQHHVCHAASAFYCSPFDEAAILTVDGSGEMASSTLSVGRGKDIDRLQERFFPHSLGYLYVALTHYLGFIPDSDEYKVMALSSFGHPTFVDAFSKIVRLEPEGRYSLDLGYFQFQKGMRDPWVSDRFIRRFGPVRGPDEPVSQRHHDIAFALQRRVEDTVLHMARHLRRRTGLSKLCYAGGVALNAVLNTRLREEAGFEDVFIQPGANDAGTALGSALFVAHHHLGLPRRFVLRDAALGPAYTAEECRAALRSAGFSFEELTEEALIARTAEALDDGLVVGWFQGRMEFGPRALGHRSILADPRRPEMKHVINGKVKHREAFRPFAPAVLAEAASEWFDCRWSSPFMLYVVDVRPDRRAEVPAVVHVDGTARMQTVERDVQPLFWSLIDAFGRRTGVPMLINTSFNVMGEPIVCTPDDAVACYASTGIDALAIGPFWTSKLSG